MAVQSIKIYGEIVKVILKPTKTFPNGYFYTDNSPIALNLINSYTWRLARKDKVTYVVASTYGQVLLHFHQEYAYRLLNYYPDYIDHIDGSGIDNRNLNLNVVTQQQNARNKPSKGYVFNSKYNYFQPRYALDGKNYYRSNCKTEPEVLLTVSNLRQLIYPDYDYNFLLDRRDDLDILDLELTKKITPQEATYLHVKRYVENNPWYVYRYNLFDYCKKHNINIPSFELDSQGFMINPATNKRLCPY